MTSVIDDIKLDVQY